MRVALFSALFVVAFGYAWNWLVGDILDSQGQASDQQKRDGSRAQTLIRYRR